MTHLFTSYVNVTDDKEVKDLYINELIPQWVKVNSKYIDNITLVTDAPHLFDKIQNLKVLKISTLDAFCTYDYTKDKKIFHHQVGCWKFFLNTIPLNHVALYMDPDAFMLDNTLLTISDRVNDYQLSKKRFKYGDSDAGVSLLRNTKKTKDMIDSVIDLFNINSIDSTSKHTEAFTNSQLRCIIEARHDRLHSDLNPDFFISWRDHTLCLRNQVCGVNKKINTIHGIYTLSPELLSSDERLLVDIITKKEELRRY